MNSNFPHLGREFAPNWVIFGSPAHQIEYHDVTYQNGDHFRSNGPSERVYRTEITLETHQTCMGLWLYPHLPMHNLAGNRREIERHHGPKCPELYGSLWTVIESHRIPPELGTLDQVGNMCIACNAVGLPPIRNTFVPMGQNRPTDQKKNLRGV